MSTEADAVGALTDADEELAKVESHEEAAHEKRNWVRLTYDCNNHCTFCLDTMAHNGTMRGVMDVKVQIIEGRKKGCDRLILSGGEPTMHPNFLDFVKLGRRAGYPKIQTVTNGRMFQYPEFLQEAAENGLHEITFSVHGHTAKLHDALVGTPGAFEQETAGLKAALASRRFIVNVDVVINKQNVKHLPEMLETFIGWGVKEFDLLHIIPFGNAWGPAKEHLFYDLEGNEEALYKAFSYARRPDIHIWLNRFPPPYTEGFEDLIQDPYKMNDEVRGRREEFDQYLSVGKKLHCREPERCHYCYLNQLCDTLDDALEERRLEKVEVLRLQEPAPISGSLPEAEAVHAVADDLEAAERLARRSQASQLYLEVPSYAGLKVEDGKVFEKTLARCYAATAEELDRLVGLELPETTIVAYLNRETAEWIHARSELPLRFMVAQPNYDRVTANRRNDPKDLRSFYASLPPEVQTENVPPCIGGREPVAPKSRLDGGMLGADARVHMPAYTQRYIADRYYTKSRRCKDCAYDGSCRGVHINFVRAHGYAPLQPIEESDRAAE